MPDLNSVLNRFLDAYAAHPIQCTLCAIFILIIVAVICFNPGSVKWLVTRKATIFHKQWKGNLANAIGHACIVMLIVIIPTALVVLVLHSGLNVPLGLNYDSGDPNEIKQVTTITTTVFTTLMSVILALVTLAVTAYVFLNDALTKRSECERGVIVDLKESTRRKLFAECVFSGLCILVILVVDNAVLQIKGERMDWLRYAVVAISLLDCILLIALICDIVNYEKRLLALALSYIDFNGKKLVEELHNTEQTAFQRLIGFLQSILNWVVRIFKTDKTNGSTTTATAEVVKSIGDLEMLLSSILSNHEAEYRFQKGMTSEVMLKNILINKQQANDEKDNESNSDKTEKLYSSYRRLVELRNCLWVLQNAGLEQKAQEELSGRAKQIRDSLKEFAFCDERFIELNFNNIDFSDYRFEKAIFRKSALMSVNFKNAHLEEADFSGALLKSPDFRGANCTGAIFRDARIISPKIDTSSVFMNAVFRDCEITMDTDTQQNEEKMPNAQSVSVKQDESGRSTKETAQFDFSVIAAKQVNVLGIRLCNFNFENSVFSTAQFTGAQLSACNFSNADFSEALLSKAEIDQNCVFSYANCIGLVGANSRWGKSEATFPLEMLNLTGARFQRANLAQSTLGQCNFHKAYLNDASLTGAKVEYCCFYGAFMNNVDFTNTSLMGCNFSDAFLSNTLLIGDETNNTISYTHYNKAEMKGCSIRNHRFENCRFDFAILDDALIRDVTFYRCSFQNTHFDGAMLFHVTWEKCTGYPETQEKNIEFGTQDDRIAWKTQWESQ